MRERKKGEKRGERNEEKRGEKVRGRGRKEKRAKRAENRLHFLTFHSAKDPRSLENIC